MSKDTVSITLDRNNRDKLKKLAEHLKWSYDALIEDMIVYYLKYKT